MANLMPTRWITATRIHDGDKWLPENSAISLAPDGTILEVIQGPADGATHYEGTICPGFVNAHCHLELSHLRGAVPQHTGLIPFLMQIPATRDNYTDADKMTARHNAHAELIRNGVVAVGDIANTTDCLDLRALGKLHFCTFVELLGSNGQFAEWAYQFGTNTLQAYQLQPTAGKTLHQYLVPHAPYSVSEQLFHLINNHEGNLMSIHNQESEAENEYYHHKTGAVKDLFQKLGIDDSSFSAYRADTLPTYGQWLSPGKQLLLVHNTYSKAEDIAFARGRFQHLFWCLCPNANLYIENRLPDIDLLHTSGANICIGTDSLASNTQLSVLAELETINHHYPHIGWETLLRWGTHHGAQALQLDDIIGTITPGKKPGILHLTNLGQPDMPATVAVIA